MKRSERRALLTPSRLRELLDYSPETGNFTTLVPRGAAPAGKKVGALDSAGYVWVTIDRVQYSAGRLAWFYVNEEWPRGEIDHIDGNPSNNSWANIRDVSSTVNKQNKRRAQSGKMYSPMLGAQWCKQVNKWKSSIRVAGRIRFLGFFKTDAEAAAAYLEAKRRLHEGCTI